MDRESSLSESNISTLCLGYTKFRYGIIQIGTISTETPNRNSQLDIYIKSLSNGYQSQLIIKISIQDLIYHKLYISLFLFFLFEQLSISRKIEATFSYLNFNVHNIYMKRKKIVGKIEKSCTHAISHGISHAQT